jgi:hypothetical protein
MPMEKKNYVSAKQYITPEVTARLLGMRPNTIQALVLGGQLRWLVDLDDVLRLDEDLSRLPAPGGGKGPKQANDPEEAEKYEDKQEEEPVAQHQAKH